MKKRSILVTSALPYANGPLHLGHMVEHIQTDVWARSLIMSGHRCIRICGDDAHGTPIMLKAESLGITPEQLISEVKASHEADFRDFGVEYDSYHTTHSNENRELAEFIYKRLLENGHIEKRTIQQAFDPIKQLFLPDRYVKGNCPKCGAADQYGDNCESCGATYSPTELKNPISVLSGATPIQKESMHCFFDLPKFEILLQEWIVAGHLQDQVANKLKEWFASGLTQWDISRDAPYFGFEIPGEPGKYFYVWLDAPIGYMASFKKYCNENNVDFNEYWGPNSPHELHHFIGKDIVYFHALFWPAMLASSGFRLPTSIHAHGFLTVEGQKMSKSRGTFIKARTFLNHVPSEYLRYYFSAKQGASLDDLDLNFEDFTLRINSDLVGKFVNIASRCSGFIHKFSNGQLADQLDNPELYALFCEKGNAIETAYHDLEYSRAIRLIMELADNANQYIDEHKPWALAKDPNNTARVQAVCSMALNLFRLLMLYLKPILPMTAKKVEAFLNIPALDFQAKETPLLAHHINQYQPLMHRITMDTLNSMIDEEKASQEVKTEVPASTRDPIAAEISIDDFSKVDLRVAKILSAQSVEGADKLLQLSVDIGDGETRQIFAGIKSAYPPEDLVGRYTVVVANLAPRKMRFGMSEGMILAASGKEKSGLWILSPDSGAEAGMRIK